jgi:glutamine cyclotransferase
MEYLNGIAYNEKSNTFFIAGKNFPFVVEVRFN